MGLQSSGEANRLPAASSVEPQLGLVGEGGQWVTLESVRGVYVLVSFGFTQFPDVCPSTLMSVAAALERLGSLSEGIRPILVTRDPERDNAQRLPSYTRAFDARIERLCGSDKATRQTAESSSVRYDRVVLDEGGYTAGLFLLGPEGDCLAAYSRDRAPDSSIARTKRSGGIESRPPSAHVVSNSHGMRPSASAC